LMGVRRNMNPLKLAGRGYLPRKSKDVFFSGNHNLKKKRSR